MHASSSSAVQHGLTRQGDPSVAARPLYAPPRHRDGVVVASLPFDENDPSVYFDRENDAWRCEVPDQTPGSNQDTELEWNDVQRKWIIVLDDALVEAQQAAYSVPGVDESTPAAPALRREKKRRRDAGAGSEGNKQRKRVNTSVYVTGLPLDCTREEIAKTFSRYGVLNEDDAGKPKIKMYVDEKSGAFKGDALVTYFREESVELALNVLDESALRAAEGKTTPVMRLTRAEFGSDGGKGKGIQVGDQRREQDNEAERGTANAPSHRRAPLSEAEKKRLQKKYAKMNSKLIDWNSDTDDEDDAKDASAHRANNGKERAQEEGVAPSGTRQVCLRRMFTLAELEDDPSLLLDLKEDVREECESLGKVTNIVLWDKEPDGVMTIKFSNSDSAAACVKRMDGRFFAGRQISAYLLAGKPHFRRSGRTEEEDDEEGAREDAFGSWLEGETISDDD